MAPLSLRNRNDGPMNPGRRRLLAAAVALPVAGCTRGLAARGFDAEVGAARGFVTLAQALAAAPADERPFRILLHPGRWREKLVITRPNVHLIGAGAGRTVLFHDRAAGHLNPATGQPWGTFGCATLIVRAPGFVARALTIANTFDYLGHLAAPTLEQVGANGAQGVALMLDQGSDAAVLEELELSGHQDTLFVDAGHSRFLRCTISGSVDFIFGAGQARFEACELRSRFRPGKPRQGYVAAPSTARAQHSGLEFLRCRLTREPAVPDRSVALARAWRPTRDFADGRYGDPEAVGAARFEDCWMGAHIDVTRPWDPMNYSAPDGSRVELHPHEVRFYAVGNCGPGAVNTAQS